MRRVRVTSDTHMLVSEVSRVPLVPIVDGSGAGHFHGPEGWINGLSMTRIPCDEYPIIAECVAQLSDYEGLSHVVQVMVNKLKAGSSLQPHRDGLPANHRYHLPVITHKDAVWWDELNGSVHMEPFTWYGPVPYCGVLHAFHNMSPVDRIHVIVDFHRDD